MSTINIYTDRQTYIERELLYSKITGISITLFVNQCLIVNCDRKCNHRLLPVLLLRSLLSLLTPSLPHPVKFLGWKVHTYTPETVHLIGPITNLLSALYCAFWQKSFHMLMRKGKKFLKGFKFGTFIGHFRMTSLPLKGLIMSCSPSSVSASPAIRRKGQRLMQMGEQRKVMLIHVRAKCNSPVTVFDLI